MVNNPYYLLLLIIPAVLFYLRRKKSKDSFRTLIKSLYFITFLLLVLALSGFGILKEESRNYTIYVMDVSDSVSSTAREMATDLIDQRLKETSSKDYSGVVLFGENGTIEKTLQTDLRHLTFESTISGRSTNIEEALYKAIGMFPDEGKRTIVLLSDGLENSGDGRRAAIRAASAGIRLYAIPLYSEKLESEVYIHDFLVPGRIASHEIHDYTLIIDSTVPTNCRITFFKDSVYMGEERVSLYQGLNTFTYSSQFEEAGVHEYRALIEPDEDTYVENNTLTVPITVTGEPKVLLVTQNDTPYLREALRTQNIESDTVGPENIPSTSGQLLNYDSIIFDNVPSGSVSISRMNIIRDFVKNKGGGFIMMGGDKSFGAGGYYDTPLEEILPVDMDVTSSLQIPSLTMIMVIDRSGSMKSAVERGIVKLDVAKEAVMEAVEILNPFYKVGMIAFNTEPEFAVPMIEASEIDLISDQLRQVEPSGGTAMYPAMEMAYEELIKSDSAVRHMIVLSDGLSDDADFHELSRKISKDGITVSTVSVGDDADRALMENIALIGGGRSYFTADIRDVPRIFASESFIVSRAHIVEEVFLPGVSLPHNIIEGFEEGFPALDGFILTYPKSGATHILTTNEGHPLLSVWNFGLGRTASWSSDMKGRWSSALVSWDRYPQLIAQMIRWVERPTREQTLTFNFTGSGSKRIMSVNAVDKENNYLNLLDLEAIITSSKGEENRVVLSQKGPGMYSTDFEIRSEGTNIITVYDKNNEIEPEITGINIPYSTEFRPMKEDFTLLNEIAESTGGAILAGNNPDFSLIKGDEKNSRKDMKELLSLIALCIFVITIVLRLLPGEKKKTTDDSKDQSLDELRLKIDKARQDSFRNRTKDKYWFN